MEVVRRRWRVGGGCVERVQVVCAFFSGRWWGEPIKCKRESFERRSRA